LKANWNKLRQWKKTILCYLIKEVESDREEADRAAKNKHRGRIMDKPESFFQKT
jgi:hypothetical protein